MGINELTKKQLERQDSVDNAIFELIQELAGGTLNWDIEMIADVRDIIQEWVVGKMKLCSEQDFYPFLEEE